MKYEENVWYAWLGGECPVHPDSEIELVSVEGLVVIHRRAGSTDWGGRPFLFRVTKEHKAPREYWIVTDYNGYTHVRKTEPVPNCIDTVVHVREVAE